MTTDTTPLRPRAAPPAEAPTMLAVRSDVPPEPTHWAAQRYSHEAAEALASHLRPGGPVRQAMLLHLAQHPEGVSQPTLSLIALGACTRKAQAPADADMRVICGHLGAIGLLAVELSVSGAPLYFSPPARKAHRVRRLHGYTLPARIQPVQVAE